MKRLLLLTAILLSGFNDAFAYTVSLEQCIDVSNQINKGTPRVVNKYLVLDGTGCFLLQESLFFTYRYRTDAKNFKKFKANIDAENRRWCSSPDQRAVLDAVKEVYKTYVSESGQYLGRITHSKDSCTATGKDNEPNDAQIKKLLELIVAEMSKNVPQSVDSITVLNKIMLDETDNRSFVFHYELDIDMSNWTNVDLLEMKQVMGTQQKNYYCAQESIRKIRELDVGYVYKYTNKTGGFLWLNSVDPTDC